MKRIRTNLSGRPPRYPRSLTTSQPTRRSTVSLPEGMPGLLEDNGPNINPCESVLGVPQDMDPNNNLSVEQKRQCHSEIHDLAVWGWRLRARVSERVYYMIWWVRKKMPRQRVINTSLTWTHTRHAKC